MPHDYFPAPGRDLSWGLMSDAFSINCYRIVGTRIGRLRQGHVKATHNGQVGLLGDVVSRGGNQHGGTASTRGAIIAGQLTVLIRGCVVGKR